MAAILKMPFQKSNFLYENYYVWIQISLKFVAKGLIKTAILKMPFSNKISCMKIIVWIKISLKFVAKGLIKTSHHCFR